MRPCNCSCARLVAGFVSTQLPGRARCGELSSIPTATMAPYDPVNNIKFVQEVEKYPAIYNTTVEEYSSKEATDNAWQEVAIEMEDTSK